jgi:4-amino-4-deoxy-L-arabinose transferase-like glycosyltransferase
MFDRTLTTAPPIDSSARPSRLRLNAERWLRLVLPLTFFMAGMVLVPRPGLQNDEALFARSVYGVGGTAYHVSVLKHQIPVMFLNYLGALKSWLCFPALFAFGPNLWSIRVPALIGGAITIWLFFLLLEHVHSRRAAWVGTTLLATDTAFVLTTCFDWGPVMLQHLLLTAAMLLGVAFHRRRRNVLLAGCFFCVGLALWDKALSAWFISAIAIALLVLLRPELRDMFTFRRARIAAASLALGAFPLLVYNVKNHFVTFRSNAHFDTSEIPHKINIMHRTINGYGLLEYLVNWPSSPAPRAAVSGIALAAAKLHAVSGDRLTNWMVPAWIAAGVLSIWLLATPVRRTLLFCFIAFMLGWAQMVFTKGTGGSAHHTILLWPLPELFLGVVFAEASCRIGRAGVPLLTAAVCLLAAANVVNLNEYLYQFVRFGSTKYWTDAMDALPDEIRGMHAAHICIVDWGIYDSLTALTRGDLPAAFVPGPFIDMVETDDDRQQAQDLFSQPGTLFVTHTDEQQIFPNVNARLERLARETGYHKSAVVIWRDRNGRPIFQGLTYVSETRRTPGAQATTDTK